MCNRYESPAEREIEDYWHVGRANPRRWYDTPREVFPRAPGPFVRRARDDAGYSRELVVGQWGLIPWFAKTPRLSYSTNNARSEELASKATFKDPWKRGQRCIIPAWSFDEPNWESGKNVWWRFRRSDGQPWGLAGLWATWADKATGEVHESYTMLTINADTHPLMSRMHKPDPKLPPDQQDKRSVIPLDAADWDQWLTGTQAEAQSLLKLTPLGDIQRRTSMRIEVLHDTADPEKLQRAQRAVDQAMQATGVTADEAYAAESALLDWDDSDSDMGFIVTPEQARALDALALAQSAADEVLGVKQGEPGAMLDWVED